ncbi:hypothetical protein O6H91_06G089000 [Diphasiastrum complanatum]|uniref:Uncharacterized protein n=1 Tax=Diphasiastrum complanatum TaxID=34168 RepID=A0ACC2DG16_DIPCM|nr:hypothetical protein O6H91_06G089000 [Diphasiastrum complanatum]
MKLWHHHTSIALTCSLHLTHWSTTKNGDTYAAPAAFAAAAADLIRCSGTLSASGAAQEAMAASNSALLPSRRRRSGRAWDGSKGRGLKGFANQMSLLQQRRLLGRRARAGGAAAGDAGSNDAFGEEGYWDKDEGKKKLSEIEQMRELIAEAQRIQERKDAESLRNENSVKESEEEKTAKLREELARRAKEQAEQRKQAETMFQMGQRAYGRGVYDKSVTLFEAALTNVPDSSNLGGEIQLWLAMAYEAHNRHDDCIALYKRLERTHASKAVRRQAADLRYILEAPKLKISKDEMVSIPMIDTDFGSTLLLTLQ